eukprot:1194899-Prorocentrum_minimum.AAC.2
MVARTYGRVARRWQWTETGGWEYSGVAGWTNVMHMDGEEQAVALATQRPPLPPGARRQVKWSSP